VLVELLRLVLATKELLLLPSGNGEPIVLIPGWRAPELSMAPLRLFLKSRNYEAIHWGLGLNRGETESDIGLLADKVAQLARSKGGPVSLVGWSLGGVIARETARLVPGSVASVITFGTPVTGGPTFTVAAANWGNKECERIAGQISRLDENSPIIVPIVAIFSRTDRVVSWPVCIDQTSPRVKHVEVGSNHTGMGFDPDVWSVIVRHLP
jgi:pimeloyl-ACP methyl ester carboxylesterase